MEFPEVEYRRKVQEAVDRVMKAFDEVDPDVAECQLSNGVLTLRLGDGSKVILSAQPSVRQLWLAVAARAIAFHFNYDPAGSRWVDDKGKGIELLSYLKGFFRETSGIDLAV